MIIIYYILLNNNNIMHYYIILLYIIILNYMKSYVLFILYSYYLQIARQGRPLALVSGQGN